MFEEISSFFLILVLGSLAFVVIGFFQHSVSARDEFDEPKPPSRNSLLSSAVIYVVLAGCWTYLLVDLLGDDEPLWIMIAVAVFSIPYCLLDSFRHLRAALCVS